VVPRLMVLSRNGAVHDERFILSIRVLFGRIASQIVHVERCAVWESGREDRESVVSRGL